MPTILSNEKVDKSSGIVRADTKNAEDIIAICVLLDIPANSRISCLTDENAQKIIDYYKENP